MNFHKSRQVKTGTNKSDDGEPGKGDYLNLGDEARINEPSTLGGNWKWRMLPEAADAELAGRMRRLAQIYGRL